MTRVPQMSASGENAEPLAAAGTRSPESPAPAGNAESLGAAGTRSPESLVPAGNAESLDAAVARVPEILAPAGNAESLDAAVTRVPEILAPAGNAESLDAAIACGADAVYLGAGTLNARRAADNFSPDELAEIVHRCHIRGVKLYLALNVIVLENELPTLLETARAACDAGVDAVIVQDPGVARILRECAPSLRLHASTQMAVHNPEGARMLEEMGFSRVVLARECSKREIAAIVAATTLEVEVFVHGALCMCVSGQCYISSQLGQRSGNRGMCAQPCRLEFASAATSHALSLKDMSYIENVDGLRDIGVASLKIEGRMKRPEYVAAAVTACRAALAGEAPDTESLRAVFSRSGFTDGYFSEKLDIGMFGTRQKEDVTAAAGVLGKLANLYNEPKRHVQRVGTRFMFTMAENMPATLTAIDSDGNTARVSGEIPQTALSKPTDEQRAAASLSKTGGTPYRVERVDCVIGDGLMLPASAINALRRDALATLDELRGAVRPIPFFPDRLCDVAPARPPRATETEPRLRPALRARASRAARLSSAIWEASELVTLPAAEALKILPSLSASQLGRLCVAVPRVCFSAADREKLCSQLIELRDAGVRHASVGNLGALWMARDAGFLCHGEPFFNAVNSHAAAELARLGLCDIELSFELNLESAKRVRSPIPTGMTAYGHLPLMVYRNCPVKAAVGCARCAKGENFLTDRKGNRMDIRCDFGAPELLNPMPLFLADRLSELAGLDFLTLWFYDEPSEAVDRVFAAYQNGGQPPAAFTRGLAYKSLL